MKKQLGSLAVLFLLAHLLSLPPTLEDIDSINFALGVRDFDVARHQPHPPGYPVFIALGKASTAVLRLLDVPAAAPRALAVLSALAGALLVPLLFAFYRAFTADARVAWWAMAMAVCAPLFWFTALRPLSDMTGLAFAIGAQALLISAFRLKAEAADVSQPVASAFRRKSKFVPFSPGNAGPAERLIAGAALAGLAAGVRVQTVFLSGPLLLAVLVWPNPRITVRARLIAVGAAMAGIVAWGVPLLAASGGLSSYFVALGTQAGEDFSGVVMLWTRREARVAAYALLNTFIWPWAAYQLAVAVLALAAVGFLRLAWRAPASLALLLVAFVPYAAFHLLFQETITVRYALPLVVPVAFLVAYAAAAAGRIGLLVTAGSIVAASLFVTLPAARAYAQGGSPAFRLFEKFTTGAASSSASGPRRRTIAMHAVMRRLEEWEHDRHGAQAVRAPHGREWLALVEHWRQTPDSVVRFFADPRRTDLALFDPQSRQLDGSERWTLPEMPFVAGTRPGAADAYTMRPPGWMLEHGWALTAEVGGVTAKERLGPHVQPSVAWVRTRSESASLILAGRHLGSGADPPARLTLESPSGRVDSWDVRPGGFFRHVQFPAGALAGSGYLPLRVSASAADDSGRPVRVALEQFDVQSDGAVLFGYVDGWHEPEYNPETARSWRWMSERARLLVKPVGRDLALTIAGESPLRYFDRAPDVRVLVAGVEIARFAPNRDFTQQVSIPAKGLAIAGGVVVVESDLWFTPAERGESLDQRHLALRVYSVAVN